MTLEVREIDGDFQLHGELDIATERVLTEALEKRAREGEQLVLDLAGLRFLDSSGVRAIVRVAQEVGHSGSVLLRDAGPAVQRVLDLMRLDTIPNIQVARAEEPPS